MFSDPLVYEELKKTQCRDGHSEEMMKEALNFPPRYTTLRVNTLRYTVTAALELVKTIVSEGYKTRGNTPTPHVYTHPTLCDVIVIESSGKTGIQPVDAKEVIVGVQCGAAVLRGAEIYAPGVVGCPLSLARGDRVAVYADLAGKCLRGFAGPFLTHPRLFIGNGTALHSRHELFGEKPPPRGIGISLDERIFDCPSLNDTELGDIGFLQNLPSILVGHVLDPQPGEIVLDMCAAPGGKTTHIATLMKNQGTVFALDKTAKKILEIQDNCARLGISIVKTFAHDASKALSRDATDTCTPPFQAETFDRILLDAPCSALGQRPQLWSKITFAELQTYPKLQKKLFATASDLLRRGGRLVYSTCTITTEENEDMVEWALARFPSLKLISCTPGFLDSKRLGVKQKGHCDVDTLVQRFFISCSNTKSCDEDTIGFFVASFEKI